MKFSIEGDNNGSIGALGNNLTELKETLLSNFEGMEAVLLEAKSTASREAQQYEELRQMEEARVGMLEVQLQEKEESLTAKIQELEHRLTEKEDLTGLLEQRTAEITNLRSETQTRVGMLEVQLQEKEESLRMKESAIKSAIKQLEESLRMKESAIKSAIKQLEESLTAKIQEMETHNLYTTLG